MPGEGLDNDLDQAISLNDIPLVDLRNYRVPNDERGKPSWVVVFWWFIQAIAFPLSLHNFNNFRCFLLRLFGAEVGIGVVIRPTARFTYPWKVKIADYSWIGDDVVFYSIDQISIGSHCVVSQKTYLCTGSHNINDSAFALIKAPIQIGNGTWVATDCFIAPGVSIGSNSVVGARSTVMNNIPAQRVAWGTPCIPRYQREIQPN